MVYRITGGIWLLFMGLSQCGIITIPAIILGIFGVVAGVALLAGK